MKKFVLFFILILLSGCTPTENQQLSDILDEIYIESIVTEDVRFPEKFKLNNEEVVAIWSSDKPRVISIDGKITRGLYDEEVTLSVNLFYRNEVEGKSFTVTVPGSLELQGYSIVYNLNMPEQITQDLDLPTEFAFDTRGTWASSDETVLTNTGKIPDDFTGAETIILTLTLDSGYRELFTIRVSRNNHLITDRNFNGESKNLTLNDAGKLVLNADSLEGVYESKVYETLNFTDAVASWSAVSHEKGTVELLVRVRVNDEWSHYRTHGKWGLGLENRMPIIQPDPANIIADDGIVVKGQKTAEAIQFKTILRRETLSDTSPELALIAAALNVPNYIYKVDTSKLRSKIDYDVPMLDQRIVPEIGNIICSPTSSTMLLLYKGHDFSNVEGFDYPHEYIANLVKDYGRTSYAYGSWTYNTVGISAFDEISYVKRMYSGDELLYHLDNIGPISASVQGTLIGEFGNPWYTNGHLIVVRGYRIEDEQVYILANDPYIDNVYEGYKIKTL